MRCFLTASAWSRNHLTWSSGFSGKPAYSPLFQIPTRIWKKPTESASPKLRFLTPDSTSEAITGSCFGQPALLGLAAHPGGELRLAPRRRRGTGWRRPVPTAAAATSATPAPPPGAAWSATPAGAGGAIGGAPPGTSALTRMNLTLAMSTPRGTFMTWSWLLPSSAVNLPPSTLLARKPMWPSEPKSSWWPQS